jgi:hypothetical protein
MPKPFNLGKAFFLNCRQATFHRIPTLIPTAGRPEIIRLSEIQGKPEG